MSERVMPGTVPVTGLPEFRPYVYRGTGEDQITPDLAGGGATQRRNWARGARPGPVVDADGRCVSCGYLASGRNHKTMCA
jgi:hypothetical protein